MTMNQRCQRGRTQLGTVQYSRRPSGHVITHFTCAQQPPVGGKQNQDTQVCSSNNLYLFFFFKPVNVGFPSLGMRTGLKIPSSSSSSSCWHTPTPDLSPISWSPIPAPLPPFSRPQEPTLFRLLLSDPGPTSPSSWFLELWISLCLCAEGRGEPGGNI